MLSMFQLSSVIRCLYWGSHMIDNNSFFLLSFMLEASRPFFKSLKTERKRILARNQSLAVIDHRFIFCEKVSCFIISHFKISVWRCFNVFWSMIFLSIILGFTWWNRNNLQLLKNLHLYFVNVINEEEWQQ